MRISLTCGAAAAAVASTLTVALTAGPAAADLGGGGGTDTDGGYGAGATHVTVTGHVSQALRASVPGPPPLCWWEPISTSWDVDPDDPEAVQKYWDEELRPYLTGHAAEGTQSVHYERFEQAIKAHARGEDITWYRLRINQGAAPGGDGYEQAAALDAAGCGSGTQPGREGPILVTYDWFPTGQQPEPVVDPLILAEYAYEVMDLVEPTLDWNPKIGNVANASLVNLATWMWVDDVAAVGERRVTATAGPVSVTVVATTDGLSVTSPAGTTRCDAEQARRAYAPGASEDAACTLSFGRASWGYPSGFPVEASAVWQATWTSNQGDADTLENKTRGATTYIPVAESQALVNAVD